MMKTRDDGKMPSSINVYDANGKTHDRSALAHKWPIRPHDTEANSHKTGRYNAFGNNCQHFTKDFRKALLLYEDGFPKTEVSKFGSDVYKLAGSALRNVWTVKSSL